MAKQRIADWVAEMAEPIAAGRGLEVVEVEYKKEGANWMLRVMIDRPGGAVDLDDCAAVSEGLSVRLDERDPIPNPYFLEVSSAGAERPLKTQRDYEHAIGKRVLLSFYEPFMGRKSVEGTLLLAENGELSVEQADGEFRVPLAKVASARLALVW